MELFVMGLHALASPEIILWLVAGVTFGVTFGALPGVSATMAIVLCISFTYTMKPVVAIAFLAAVYCSAITAAVSRPFFSRSPHALQCRYGTRWISDGPARRGGKALSISLICSGLGGLFSAIIMFLLTQPLMALALEFGSEEMFAVCTLGLCAIVFLDEDHKLNTFASAIIGLWLGTVGMDYFSSVPRFTFGVSKLLDGVEDLPFMLGLFAAVEIYNTVYKPRDLAAYTKDKQADISKLAKFKDIWELKWTSLRSGIIGTLVGIMPGCGRDHCLVAVLCD